jgi:hypothetical protein
MYKTVAIRPIALNDLDFAANGIHFVVLGVGDQLGLNTLPKGSSE